MRSVFLPALILVFTVAHPGAAGDKQAGGGTEPKVDGRTLSEWVELLRSGDVVERQGAVLALGKMGAPAVPTLAEALQDK